MSALAPHFKFGRISALRTQEEAKFVFYFMSVCIISMLLRKPLGFVLRLMKQETAHLGFYNLVQTGNARPNAGFIQLVNDLVKIGKTFGDTTTTNRKRVIIIFYSQDYDRFNLLSTYIELGHRFPPPSAIQFNFEK